MATVHSIENDEKNDGYAFVKLRISKQSPLFHQLVEDYKQGKIIMVEIRHAN
jgi:hypothetical protein